jgi:L-ascorbate metabolism protein UlaG (beta-lactamase superfamily)
MRIVIEAVAVVAALSFFLFSNIVAAAEIEVLWLGHAATRITSVEGKVIVIDPFIKKNPKTPAKYRNLEALGKVDLILITHGHRDHVMDLPELASLTGAKVVAPYGYVTNIVELGLIDGAKAIGMNKGGTVTPLGRGIKVHMVPAEHASHLDLSVFGVKDGKLGGLKAVDGGTAVGYVIEFENGFKIYHSGDTAVFSDMALIREFYQPDLALVPIGGHFSMGPEGAAYALSKFIKPKQVIPIHYGTFPVLNRTPAELKKALGNSPVEVIDVKPGQAVRF